MTSDFFDSNYPMSFAVYPSTQASATPKGIWLFDVDGTLIVSKSGRRFGNDNHDWVFLGSVPQTLNELAADGWLIALVSNQSDWKRTPAAKLRLESVQAALMTANGWVPWLLVATAGRKERDTLYRKPGRGLFDVLMSEITKSGGGPGGSELRMTGDAVGPDDAFPPYRWASSDRDFATSIGAEFSRPCDVFPPCEPFVPSATQELVILMGNAGSGKTTTGRKMAAASIVHIEQDNVGTHAAVRRAVLAGLNSGNSVVVDATHGSAKNREPWIALARDRGIPCRILWHIRDGRSFNSLREKQVPEVAYAVYSKHFVEPTEFEIVY